MKTLLVLCGLCLVLSPAASAEDQALIVLSMQLYSDGELVSEPKVALAPGTDASVMQGIEDAGFDEDLVLKLAFHSVHLREKGPELLVDADFGIDEPQHLSADHVVMAWNEPYEFSFRVAPDAPTISVRITPSRSTRGDFLGARKPAGK